ncbi:hypothetical protein [Streptomyces sp. HNM0574]|uniref:hypothetical protein n=1 Tax=Streptomyces sp. HNM0574 TaxID=2714954 RepID=UPI00146C6A66|nr:hypothetical protein [Streptomyces sp. HNM0574]NLU70850.1 hypothetical protein [Streptomyces sp. HNM0574]
MLLGLLRPTGSRALVLGALMTVGGIAGSVVTLTGGKGLGIAAVQAIVGLAGMGILTSCLLAMKK